MQLPHSAPGVVRYFAFTFVLTWSLWLAASRLAPQVQFGWLLFLPGTFVPALVAIGLTERIDGRARTTMLLRRMLAWRVHWRWYAFALGYMITIKLTAAAVYRVTTGAWPVFGDTSPLLVLAGVLVSTPFQMGEELGWRGYALPRLTRSLGARTASILLGVIWAFWHLPMFFIAGGDMAGQAFPVFLVTLSAVSVAMSWLYVKTRGSLLLCMVMHSAINNTTGIVPSAAVTSSVFAFSSSRLGWLTALTSWVIAGVCLWNMRSGAERPGAAIHINTA